ncbi:MAG: hypothetical protein ABIP53_02490 [Candidatus Limnocylindrales bacterium]
MTDRLLEAGEVAEFLKVPVCGFDRRHATGTCRLSRLRYIVWWSS